MRKILLIIAAGNGTRMGINFPKALYPINGLPNIEWLLKSTDNFFDNIYIAVKNESEHHFLYLKDRYKTITIIPIKSGFGDGHAILECLNFTPISKSDELYICWGDVYCNSNYIFDALSKTHIESLIIPAVYEKNPYVFFDYTLYNNEIVCSRFSKYGEVIDYGYHDQSIFRCNSITIDALKSMHNTHWKKDHYETKNGELNFLNVTQYLYNQNVPAKIIDIPFLHKTNSFNTIQEVEYIE